MKKVRLKRRKPLERGKTSLRASAAATRGWQRRSARKRADRAHADPSFQYVRGPCEVCRKRPAVHGHHAYKQQWLRDYHRARVARALAVRPLRDLLSDLRNRVAVCWDCHQDHEYGVDGERRIPRSAIRAETWEFVRELGEAAVVRVERDYPDR